jgi:hypothetical protein
MQPLPNPAREYLANAPQDPSLLSEQLRSKRRLEYLTACEERVFTALDSMEGIGWPGPYTAKRVCDVLRGAEERILGEPITMDDVLCGLLQLRKKRALVAVAKGEETFYALKPGIARAGGG